MFQIVLVIKPRCNRSKCNVLASKRKEMTGIIHVKNPCKTVYSFAASFIASRSMGASCFLLFLVTCWYQAYRTSFSPL